MQGGAMKRYRGFSRGAPTQQRARFGPALRAEAKCRARFGAALAKGNTLRVGRLRAIIGIAPQRMPLILLKIGSYHCKRKLTGSSVWCGLPGKAPIWRAASIAA